MNFTSQICTTKEQSKRLLSLGLKRETADMKYPYEAEIYWGIITGSLSSLPIIISTEDDEATEDDLPAWSLNRLIELSDISVMNSSTDNIYDKVIQYIEFLIKCGDFNKEYLN